MHRIKLSLGLVLTLGVASIAGGCVAHAGVGGEVVVADPAPQVVMVAPGVWVVENHHQAVFYSDGYYWRRHGSVWYRSSYYDSGYVVVGARFVPRPIYSVRSHRRYVRYRARANARRARAIRRHNRAVRRDNRRQARENRRDYRRQKRQDRRDYRKAKRQDRRDYRKAKREKKRDKRKKKKRKSFRDYRR